MATVDAMTETIGHGAPAKRIARKVDPDVVGRRTISHALFVAPYFVVFILLIVVPLFLGAWLSLQDYDMLGGYGGFVGLKNFEDLFRDRIFVQTIWNTILFVVLTVPSFIVVGLFLALALNNAWRSSVILRSVFFGSLVLSVTIVTLVWRLVYMPDRGLLFNITSAIGLPAPNFIADATLALPGIAIVTVWWTIGLPMMLFLAALQQIPDEVYEAAALDNASRWRTLTKITLPAIRRTILLVAVLEIVLQFQLFGQANLITNGGPNNASRPMVMFIYEAGFRDWALGYAAAASQVLFFVMLIAAAAQMWVARQKDD
ncbi:sugar ABC transporter permease [Bosea sp. BK604]|uniref:carbohydrate ABC transporter permease n=1 Tax=Bosea sp. BK604 TaxID=2512180 RepID=UPI0010E7F2CB|nr:sugar ABC transporter permease [Bosea sp. BK604]TCR66429.1 carbohydrate ABC transporter membrane protein 1 (CUT1 family) [Bosea sp. BK604]